MIDKRLEELASPTNIAYIDTILAKPLPEWKDPRKEDGTYDGLTNRVRNKIQREQKRVRQIKEVIDKREQISKLAQMIADMKSKVTEASDEICEYMEQHDLYGMVSFDPDSVGYMLDGSDPVEDAMRWMSSNHSC